MILTIALCRKQAWKIVLSFWVVILCLIFFNCALTTPPPKKLTFFVRNLGFPALIMRLGLQQTLDCQQLV